MSPSALSQSQITGLVGLALVVSLLVCPSWPLAFGLFVVAGAGAFTREQEERAARDAQVHREALARLTELDSRIHTVSVELEKLSKTLVAVDNRTRPSR